MPIVVLQLPDVKRKTETRPREMSILPGRDLSALGEGEKAGAR